MSILKKFFNKDNLPNSKNSFSSKKKNFRTLQEKIKKLEIEKENLFILREVTNILASDLNFERISQKIVNLMVDKLNYTGGILSIKKENNLCAWTISETKALKIVLSLLPKKFRDYHTPLIKSNKNYFAKTIMEQKIFTNKNLTDYLSPPVPKSIVLFSQKVTKSKATISLPIIIKKQAIGALMFNSKREQFTKSEIEILKTFANQAGIAINNARMYEHAQNQAKELGEKAKDLQGLFQVSQIAVSSLQTKLITQKIMNEIPNLFRHLGYLGAILTLYNEKNRLVKIYSLTESKITKSAKKLLKKPFCKYQEKIDKADNFTAKAIKTKQMYLGKNLKDFISPTVAPSIALAIQKLVGMKSSIIVPVFSSNGAAGAFQLIISRPLKKITQKDKELCFALANHIGMTLENIKLFEKVQCQLKELKSAYRELQKINKAKTEFLSMASHQLRTPLTIIKGYSSMLLEGTYGEFGKKGQKALQNVLISTDRLIKIINDLLNISRIELGKLKIDKSFVQIEEIVDSVRKEMKMKAKAKKLKLIYDKPKILLPKINVDRLKIRQVVSNIVDNAIKYTNKGYVSIKISKSVIKDKIIIEIKDTGEGMTQEEQSKVFQRFTRGAAGLNYWIQGTGLGLYLAKKLVEMHKGSIWIKSEGTGKGCSFYIELPVK